MILTLSEHGSTLNPHDPSCISFMILSVYGGATQRSHVVKKDLLYRFPRISLYCDAWILILLASLVSFGNNLLNSTSFMRCSKVIDASLLSVSAFLFRYLLSDLPEVGNPRIFALSASSVYCMLFLSSHHLSALKKARDLSAPFDKNWLRAASFVLRLCMSFNVLGWSRSVTALTLKDWILCPS
ncbi:hypothetical protein Tco_1125053 [Tanacetum coccineum]|uniref:Vomeronasal type-1 receptor n=1 Tax=Tanacetum coccineum TaxID=301880 RepID=A0ABQ5JAQ8_9ASTR